MAIPITQKVRTALHQLLQREAAAVLQPSHVRLGAGGHHGGDGDDDVVGGEPGGDGDDVAGREPGGDGDHFADCHRPPGGVHEGGHRVGHG